MKTKTLAIGMLALAAALAGGTVLAAGEGPGAHMMGRMHGSDASAAEMQGIHALFASHERIARTVTNLPNGIRTVTESDDPQVAQTIKEHVATMIKRVDEKRNPGLPIQSRALHAIFANHDKVETKVETTEKGVIVIQTSDDAATVAALQKHAAEVTAFVDQGMPAMHAGMAEHGAMPMAMAGRGMMGRMGGMHRHGPAASPPANPQDGAPR